MTRKLEIKESRELRKEAAKFMDGLIKFKSPIIEALDRTFWRAFFYGLFFILGKYITIGLHDEIKKIFNWIKTENWEEFDSYVAKLLDDKIDIPFIEDKYELQYFKTAIGFLHGSITVIKNKILEVYNSAEADDPILSGE